MRHLGCSIDIQIRPAQLSDAAVIAEFNQRLAEETENLRLDPACVGAGVAALLEDPAKGVYYLAETDGIVVGQVMITYEWSDWRNGNLWWLQSVFVKPDFRRRGIFRALFGHITELARAQKDVCGLRLYMHAANQAARRSYQNLGMKQTQYEVLELGLNGRADFM
jgi:GNAT superfamily N-acetyltransferase